ADGLNTLSQVADWHQRFTSDAILTPHPGEMARLTGDRTQDDRVRVAMLFASGWRSVVVLKGAHTVIAHPDGDAVLSSFANPGLATAGTGDVLAGAIAGLLSQGLSRGDAAKLGVYIHGLAGERVRDDMGDTGMIASDLLPVLPRIIRDLRMGLIESDEILVSPSQ
ncbi:MAG: NAD(P)H-hydrate dehydratase, partial [SAR202 cluster bacterium]|nr:NAD(P)H-hydrate dehydratase [SAR202 cluster bacterium]